MGQNVKVLVRIRPLLNFEQEPVWMLKGNTLETVTSLSTHRNSSSDRKVQKQGKEIDYQFNFESVIGENATSQQIYKRQIRTQLIQCCRMGRNVSIMAYGQTCSGKTHTILGVKDSPGIIPCVLRDLFLIKQEKDRKCSLKVSYTEIYNEKISDLLDPKEKNIKVTESTSGGFQLSGTSRESISTFEDSMKLLERGQKRRQYGQGEHHQRSSRSHTLLSIFFDQWDANLTVKSFVITIVDLAGSERLTHERQSSQQAGYINRSLFQLTSCIAKLAQKAVHIPFRDSKLTKLLQPSLSGTGRSIIICCVSLSKSCFGETLSTLRLAERAKHIELKEPVQYITQNDAQRMRAKLDKKTKECTALKGEIESLNQQITVLDNQIRRLKNNRKQKVPANLLILLDHQNFTLFLEDHIDESITSSKNCQQLKEAFVQKLQELYESYTKSIIRHCFGDSFELQIEELCFMNMVLEHQKIVQYKIQIIDELLRQQESKSLQQKASEVFYNALSEYQHKLKQQCQYTYSIPSYRTSNNSSNYIQIENSDYSNHTNIIPKTISVRAQSDRKEECGTQILVWGCKKDFRVCKGEPSGLGMVRISNLGNIRAVVCGYHHTLAITQEGNLFGWGKNTERQLINCEKDSIPTPTLIKLPQRVQFGAAGWGHSLALSLDGELYSWGYGKDGQLGHGNRQNCLLPEVVEHEAKIASIYAGHSHSAFIDVFGDLFAFGFNQDYRLLIGEEKEVLQPRQVSIRDVVSVSLGVTHSAAIASNGSVFAGGTGRNGELGIDLNERVSGWEKMEAVDRKFQQQSFEKICPLIQIEGFGRANRAKSVKCGENMTVILNQLGEVYTFGKKLSHRLGHDRAKCHKVLQSISAIECGSRNGFALNEEENKVYSWGFNMYGQANPQGTGDIATPQLLQNLPQKKVISLSSGFFHSAILLQ